MTRDEAIKLLKGGREGIAEWNRRREAGDEVPDLSGVDLSRAELRGVNFRSMLSLEDRKLGYSYVNLSEANLSCADLGDADFVQASLRKADLHGAFMQDAKLGGTNIRNASLQHTVMIGANLTAADAQDADFSLAAFDGTIFAGNLDLSVACGLERVDFWGPCVLDVRTLGASKGRIPESFLRGCGLTPWQILEAKLCDPDLTPAEITEIQNKIFELRTKGPLVIRGVFISYSHEDATFVEKIHERLREEGISVWLDKHDLLAGPLQRQIDRAIRLHDVVLLVLSEASIESDWVEHELTAARRKEKEQDRDILCPVALDEAWKDKVLNNPDVSWEHLGKKNVLDFSQWETDGFDTQFKKLLSGLKIYYGPPSKGEVD